MRGTLDVPYGADRAAICPYLSKRLIKTLDTGLACEEDWTRQNPEPADPQAALKPWFPWFEQGLFSGSNEASTPSWAVVERSEPQKDGSYLVYVRLAYQDHGPARSTAHISSDALASHRHGDIGKQATRNRRHPPRVRRRRIYGRKDTPALRYVCWMRRPTLDWAGHHEQVALLFDAHNAVTLYARVPRRRTSRKTAIAASSPGRRRPNANLAKRRLQGHFTHRRFGVITEPLQSTSAFIVTNRAKAQNQR